jgi:hypothetical protein
VSRSVTAEDVARFLEASRPDWAPIPLECLGYNERLDCWFYIKDVGQNLIQHAEVAPGRVALWLERVGALISGAEAMVCCSGSLADECDGGSGGGGDNDNSVGRCLWRCSCGYAFSASPRCPKCCRYPVRDCDGADDLVADSLPA